MASTRWARTRRNQRSSHCSRWVRAVSRARSQGALHRRDGPRERVLSQPGNSQRWSCSDILGPRPRMATAPRRGRQADLRHGPGPPTLWRSDSPRPPHHRCSGDCEFQDRNPARNYSSPSGELKMSSMARSKTLAILKASGSEGSNRPRSIEMIVCRETPNLSARRCCDHPRSRRRSGRTFCIVQLCRC